MPDTFRLIIRISSRCRRGTWGFAGWEGQGVRLHLPHGCPAFSNSRIAAIPENACRGLTSPQWIANELEITQGKLRKLIQDIDAVDATLKPFQPDMVIGLVRVRPTPRRHTAFRGESSRLILNMLREAGGPMTTRDIVLKVMEARGLNVADRPMHEAMRMRASAPLRGLRDRGTLTSSEGRGASVLWRLV